MFLRGNYTIDFNAPGYTGLFTNIENLTLTSATDERYARGGGTEFDYNLVLSDAIVNAGRDPDGQRRLADGERDDDPRRQPGDGRHRSPVRRGGGG